MILHTCTLYVHVNFTCIQLWWSSPGFWVCCEIETLSALSQCVRWSSAHATQKKHNSCYTLLLNCHFRWSNLHQSLFVSSRCIPKRCQGKKKEPQDRRYRVNIYYANMAFLQFKLAILDYARASHLEPNNPTYYLFKVKGDSVSWLTKTIIIGLYFVHLIYHHRVNYISTWVS